MPVIGEQTDRIGDLLEELTDCMMEHVATPPQAPVVNVEAPKLPAPTVTVNVPPPEQTEARVWTFSVERKDGLITSITATAK
jgi:phenylpyruvate tautomerase PptA (4-oxalocrotonate tautomerase family)